MAKATPRELYREYPPRPALRGYIRCVWTYETQAGGDPQPVPPDGCTELIVHIGQPYSEVSSPGTPRQPPILFAGQLTRPLTLRGPRRVRLLGVRFEPDGARAFIGRSLGATTDKRLDLREEHGPKATLLLRRIRAGISWNQRIALAQNYVLAVISGSPVGIDAQVREAVHKLQYDIDTKSVFLAGRTLQRRFKEYVGVSPRTLATLFRFRRLFNAIDRPEHPGWLEAALAVGYFDQPHMAKYFRRFLGCTATEWASRKIGLATMLAQPVSESYKPTLPKGG